MMEIGSSELHLPNCCADMYNSLFVTDIEQIEISTRNSDKVWAKERQFRITGSRCYALYTYGKNNWEKKAMDYFWPKQFSSIYEYSTRVVQTGLIVSASNPWLGYSPDGIVIENGTPTKLIEIKCPYSGKSNPLVDCIKQCQFLNKTRTELKTRHQYYGQVQLGMALLNLPECDIIIYSSFDDAIRVINVKFNETLARNMLQDIKTKYFNNMFHKLCTNKTT